MISHKRLHYLSSIILFILLPNFPKIDLIGKLKIDDIIYCTLIFLLIKIRILKKVLIVYSFMFGYVLLLSINSLLNDYRFDIAYLARYFFYFSAFVLGSIIFKALSCRNLEKIQNLILLITIPQMLVVTLQKLSLLGGSYDGVWNPSVSLRPVGFTSHPTELGLMCLAFTFILFKNYEKRILDFKFFFFASVITLTVTLSEARASLILIIVTLAIHIIIKSNSLLSRIASFLVSLLFLVSSLLFLEQSDRFKNLLSRENLSVVVGTINFDQAFQDLDTIDVDINSISAQSAPSNSDDSLYIRTTKWASIINVTIQNNLLFGLGGGRFGVAVDGYFVRVFGEGGLLGLFIIFSIFYYILRNSSHDKLLRFFIIAVLINCITLDALLFSRFGYFFWCIVGIYFAKSIRKKNDLQENNILVKRLGAYD